MAETPARQGIHKILLKFGAPNKNGALFIMNELSFTASMLAVLPIYAIIASGSFARKVGWIAPSGDSTLMKVAVELTLPCFILYNLLENDQLRSVSFSISTIVLGMAITAISIFVSWIGGKILRLKVGDGLRTFVVTAGVQNYGFFIIALVAILMPNSEFTGLVLTFNVGCDLIFWSVGFLMISNAKKMSFDFLKKGPVWSVFLGLFLMWTGLDKYIGDSVKIFLKLMGGVAIPVNLMLFGTLIVDMLDLKKIAWKIVVAGTTLRMLILPAMLVLSLTFLPLSNPLKMLILMQSLAPSGVMSAVLAKHFGGHPHISVQITIATCAISLITLPLWLNLGLKIIK